MTQANGLNKNNVPSGASEMIDDTSSPTKIPRQENFGPKGVFAVVLGNALEFYDFGVYAAFAVIIGHTFFPANDPYLSLLLSVATFGVGFISRPLGGLVLGAYADRRGRKAALTLTIVLMGSSTAAIGLIPSYDSIGLLAPLLLAAARLIQGFAAGGELGASTVYLYEAAPQNRKGLYGSWQVASQGAAAIIIGLLGYSMAQLIPEQSLQSWGWRIPFILGVLIVPVGIYIRRNLDETLTVGEAPVTTTGVVSGLLRAHAGKLLLAIAAFAGVTVTQYYLYYLTTFAINSLGIEASSALLVNFVIGLCTLIFAVLGGVLGDRFGLTAVTIVPRILLMAVLYPAIALLISTPTATNLLGMAAVLTALQAISAGLLVLLIARAFPPQIRTTGLASAMGLGAAFFGGTAQVAFTWLIKVTGSPLAPVLYVLVLNVVSLTAIFCLNRKQAGNAAQLIPIPFGHSK
jgi:MFS family permease